MTKAIIVQKALLAAYKVPSRVMPLCTFPAMHAVQHGTFVSANDNVTVLDLTLYPPPAPRRCYLLSEAVT